MQEDVYQGDGLNLYAYCDNNPVMYYDPSGYEKKMQIKNPQCPGAENGGDGNKGGSKSYLSNQQANKIKSEIRNIVLEYILCGELRLWKRK